MIHWLDEQFHILSVIWLLPITFMFHDFEEILTVEKWLNKNRESVKSHFPAFIIKRVEKRLYINTLTFAKDVLWVFIVMTTSTVLFVFFSFSYLYLICLIIFFGHVFTHVGQSIYLKRYTPGVITSIFIVLPYSTYAFYRLFKADLVQSNQLYLSLLLLIIAVPLLIGFLARKKA
ncbi:MAG: HXXEE domain-containing protein [Tuberibacillus sp.]